MLKQITKIFSLFSKWFTNKQTKTEICLSQQKEFQRILGEQQQGGQENIWPLKHYSVICLLGLIKKVFVFMSIEATSDSFPQNRQVHIDGSK